jgi:(1->4)-alpha-D-glucan 1-alpha-D-glucosylmutase
MTVPRATYRLQFRDGMDFDRAVGIVPYLKRLGISHLYASPIFTAVSGSTHGYDVTDHNAIDPVLGGREGFERLCMALKQAGLGLILDIVPNHMAASLQNPWWRDVLEWGEHSTFARHFDIDWREKLTLPILGRPLGESLSAGELALRLDRQQGGLVLAYFDNHLPLFPSTYRALLSSCAGRLSEELIGCAQSATPGSSSAMHAQMKHLLADQHESRRLDEQLGSLSADRAAVQVVLAAQPWRLTFWKEARRHLSYRRFFEVTGLVGVSVEDPAVFDDVHRLVLELVRSGQVDGLRIDHVDGLADPGGYLERLRREVGPDAYLVVEKILNGSERLPDDWPIAGTTGYEFIATMADILVDKDGVTELLQHYASDGGGTDLEAERRRAKRLLVSDNFATELSALVDLARSAGPDEGDELRPDELRAAIVDLVVAFPVYRTYGDEGGMSEANRLLLEQVAQNARGTGAETGAQAFILSLLTDALASPVAAQFRRRFQQLTGPVMAKAVEDTLFYRCNHLIALNEVGCDPGEMAASPQEAHARLAALAGRDTTGLLATATHDTKRGEDARARLYTLSEAPTAWGKAVERWRAMHAGHVQILDDGPAPEPQTEWLLYQALAGVCPDKPGGMDAAALERLSARFQPYVEKALREAKLRTDWVHPNEAYETAVKSYAAALLSAGNARFLEDFSRTMRPFVRAGKVNALAQTLIKLTAPGIPDIYQGTETEDLSLVDPDNRQPVDFEGLTHRLSAARQPLSMEHVENGTAKQMLVAQCLAYRGEHEALFRDGDYVPLRVSGARQDNVFSFARQRGNDIAVVVVPRLIVPLCQDESIQMGEDFWSDTRIELPADRSDRRLSTVVGSASALSGDRLLVANVLDDFPVALLAGS